MVTNVSHLALEKWLTVFFMPIKVRLLWLS